MNRNAFTFLLILIAAGIVFAGVGPTVTIMQPNGGELIKGDYNIIFQITGFSAIGNIDLGTTDLSLYVNDSNFFNNNKIECLSPISTDPVCYYLFDTTKVLDNTYTAIVDPNDTTPVSFATDVSDNIFTIDNTPPTISPQYPTQGSWINPDLNFLKASITDATSGVDANSIVVDFNGTDYNIDNRVFYASGVMDFNMMDLGMENKTNYNIVIDAKDNAGNNKSYNYSIWVDNNSPTLNSATTPTKTNDTTPRLSQPRQTVNQD